MSSQNQYFLNTNPTYPSSTMSTGLDSLLAFLESV